MSSSTHDVQVSFWTEPFHSDLDELLKRTEDSTSVDPQLLMKSAGKEACCIFRVPESFAEMNPEAYKPKVVSIGPYHYGESHLQMIQQYKPRFLKLFLEAAKKKGVERSVLFEAVMNLEESVRISYSEQALQSSVDLVYMMILDGCFILMLLFIVSRIIEFDESEDPIFTIPWILPSIQSDILLLENQVPAIVLQTLLTHSKIDVFDDLNRMAFRFFNLSIDKPESYWVKHRDFEAKHLLDLIRATFIPNMRSICESDDFKLTKGESGNMSSSDFTLIMSATTLSQQGIKFSVRSDADTALDIRVKWNRLQIPVLRLDGFTSSVLLNCVAFEQFYNNSTNDITSYVVFMGCLLDSEEDAKFLSNDNRIIENYFGSEKDLTRFFTTICRDVVFDIRKSYLSNVFEGVNKYTSRWYSPITSPWFTFESFVSISSSILQTVGSLLYFLRDQQQQQQPETQG